MAKFAKRADQEKASPKVAESLEPCAFDRQFPALAEYLSLDRWEDGRPREVATLMILQEEGLWKACLNDRANQRSCWVSAPTYTLLVARLEAVLANGEAEWRKRSMPAHGKKKAS